ncbi:uncharacterized protein EDB91DRAFT_1052118 [Suillus paluster]|uniref:uncharacterized protein n=1 Tax=Suillus paluster TaxID=48578 RepID=UPI001B87701E|nr:uncharacterized protein EDB91DRAFT_1052118 [Suillus paluster]KAG1742374.1 hypothetical protein EDB91DRAFT_1052118 [Suillus paluster]
MCESASNASDLLPINFVGTAMAAVQNEDGKFRIYFQNKDYQIFEMSLNDPKSTVHTLVKLTTSGMPAARINTPIAAVACKDLREIRVYYITTTSRVQEMCHTQGKGWVKCATLGTAAENSSCLYAQQRNAHDVSIRVGFQSAAAPQTITEACYNEHQGWKSRVL